MERKLPERKVCPTCKRCLPAGEFYVVRGGFGLSGWCRACQREYNNTRDRRGERWSRWISHGRYTEPPEKEKTLVRCVETGETFETYRAAGKSLGCSADNIRNAVRRYGRACGYHWERVSAGK